MSFSKYAIQVVMFFEEKNVESFFTQWFIGETGVGDVFKTILSMSFRKTLR